MMVLFHYPLSVPSRLARLILGETDLPHELVEERIWERREAFLITNPAGTLPMLLDGGAPVCGIWAVCEYLDEAHGAALGQNRLMPQDPLSRAEVRRLLEWFLMKFEEEVAFYLVEEKVLKRMRAKTGNGNGAPDSARLRAARANIRVHLHYIEHLLEERRWLAGDAISYADLAAAAALSVADYLGEVPWEHAPEAKDWYARMKSRPAFRPLLTDEVRGIAPPAHYADLDF